MKIRKRVPVLSLAFVLVVAVMTIGNAVANVVLTFKLPTTAQLQRAEQDDRTEARKAHLAALIAAGDHCRPAIAHEIAEGLVFDGKPATAFAADYTARCGADPVVDKWAALSPKLFAAIAKYTRHK